jgi:type IV secretion system protein VirB10
MDPIDRENDETREGSDVAPPLPPRDPAREHQITMLNRKAIVVLAGIAGMTVMVVSFAFNAPKHGPANAYDSTVPAEQVGDDGVRQNYLASPPDTGRFGRQAVDAAALQRQANPSIPAAGEAVSGSGTFNAPAPADVYDPYAIAAYTPQTRTREPVRPEPDRPDPRELAFERAMRCGIRTCPAEPTGDRSVAAAAAAGLDAAWMLPEPVPLQAPAEHRESPASEPRERHDAFQQSAAGSRTEPYVAARLQRPESPYEIMAGTLIPVTLVTGINSDLPGEVVAQVTRNVYDTQQRHLLIPAGSRVLGQVDNQVGLGQARVNIAWHRLILPNNSSLSLPGFAGVDARGAAGIRDHVNNHYARTYVNALLLSALTAGAQLSQPQAANVYTSPSVGQIAAGAVGQRVGDVSSEMIRRNMQVGPTLEVRPGFKFSIYVSQDLILPPYDRYGDS